MDLNTVPDFIALARISVEIFHPEVLKFPADIVDEVVEVKAKNLREHYEALLRERQQ